MVKKVKHLEKQAKNYIFCQTGHKQNNYLTAWVQINTNVALFLLDATNNLLLNMGKTGVYYNLVLHVVNKELCATIL